MHLDLPRRFPWSTVLSVTLHGAVVVGLLYVSVHKVVELPAPAQVISVSMVAPSSLEPPKPETVEPPPQPVAEPEPQPVVEPEPEPEPIPEPPKEAPVVIEKPKPKPKPKPRPEPVKKVVPPKPVTKPVTKAAEPARAAPLAQTAPSQQAAAPAAAPQSAPAPSVTSGPRPVSRSEPLYPPRAYALRQEGKVSVKFDVDADGSLSNVEILSAKPSNMFEREVRMAMRKWRYESGKPAKGIIVNISFQINNGSKVE